MVATFWHSRYGTISLLKSLLSLVSKDFKIINDLVDIEGSIKNWETISKELNLNPIHFFERYGVCSSIPNKWKRTVKGYLNNSSDSSVLHVMF